MHVTSVLDMYSFQVCTYEEYKALINLSGSPQGHPQYDILATLCGMHVAHGHSTHAEAFTLLKLQLALGPTRGAAANALFCGSASCECAPTAGQGPQGPADPRLVGTWFAWTSTAGRRPAGVGPDGLSWRGIPCPPAKSGVLAAQSPSRPWVVLRDFAIQQTLGDGGRVCRDPPGL